MNADLTLILAVLLLSVPLSPQDRLTKVLALLRSEPMASIDALQDRLGESLDEDPDVRCVSGDRCPNLYLRTQDRRCELRVLRSPTAEIAVLSGGVDLPVNSKDAALAAAGRLLSEAGIAGKDMSAALKALRRRGKSSSLVALRGAREGTLILDLTLLDSNRRTLRVNFDVDDRRAPTE